MAGDVESRIDRLIQEEISRRKLLKRIGLAGALLPVPALLAACADSGGDGKGEGEDQRKASTKEIDSLTWGTFGGSTTLFLPQNASIPAMSARSSIGRS